MSAILWIAIVWVGPGLVLSPLTYGVSLAYWQRKYPSLASRGYEEDVAHALGDVGLSLLIPFGALICLSMYHFGITYGLQYGRPGPATDPHPRG